MVTWPSGKAKVCKTFIHQFKSGRHLHKTVMKKISQSFFFVVASKIGDFANRFLDTTLQCCPTILGRFSQLDAHFSCRFLEFGRGGGNFFEKEQNKSCRFQNVFNFLAANFWTAPHLLDSMVYCLGNGVFLYAKRSTKQTIYAGIQENGCRNHGKRTSEYLCNDAGIRN